MSEAPKKKEESEKVVHSYHDHANDAEEESSLQSHLTELSLYRPADQNFTARLHRLLSCAEKDGSSHIISWQPHGRAFLVHDKKLFEQQVMPRWFQQSSMSSFLRQLNLYGFMRLHKGADKGGYYHELFLRGKPTLCRRIERTRIKGRGARKAVSHESEPDFYKMTPLPADKTGSVAPSSTSGPTAPSASTSAQTSVRSLPSFDTQASASLGVFPASHQGSHQQAAILQQLGLLQQLSGNMEGISPMPALSNTATLPHVNTTSGPGPTSGPADSTPQPIPPGAQPFDSTSIQRTPLGISHSASSFAAIQRDFLGASQSEGVQRNQNLNPLNNSLLSGSESSRGYASHPTAHSVPGASQQEQLNQQALQSSTQQQPSTSLSSSEAFFRNLPGFLSDLYEPTPFPQLPNHPPNHANRNPPNQATQGEQMFLEGNTQSTSIAQGFDPSQLLLGPQILQSHTPSSNDLRHHFFTGIHPSLSSSAGIIPGPNAEDGKEAGSSYPQELDRSREDETKETK